MIFASALRIPLEINALSMGLAFTTVLVASTTPAVDLNSVGGPDPTKPVKKCILMLQECKTRPMEKEQGAILGYTVVFTTYSGFASLLRARAALEPEWKNLSRELDKQLSLTQSLLFPKMRKAWVESINKEALKQDMKVWVMDGRSATLEIRSTQFSTRKSIDEYQKTIHDRLLEMRFKAVEYGTDRGGDVVGYRLDSPPDGNL